ncbi:MAG: hypothetical protein CVU59_11305 [Deltaproteobacteria bacterium HGW-Deltaproteobacteria-17]|nr:MAG: hypothetical protein CVU59_11305 [Deltaproteobacteria bacterium HGW-Deltaproteobacteria-17]
MLHRFFRFSLIFTLLSFSACTHLGTRHRQDYWYKTATRCAQGPFELRIPSRGAPWGEKVELTVFSPRKLGLRVDFRTDDQEQFTPTRLGDEGTMENKECLAQTGSPGSPAGGPGEADGKDPAGGSALTPPPESPGKTAANTPVPSLILQNPGDGRWQAPPSSTQNYSLILFDVQRGTPDGPPPFPKGRTIIVRIWSVLPNDFQDVGILIRHEAYVPHPNEKEYVAKLRKEERDRKRKAEKRQREWERKQRQRQREWERKQVLAAKNPPPPARPAKPRKPAKVRKPVWQACVTGRYDGGRVAICRKFGDYQEYTRCINDPADLPCWHRPRKGRWHYAIAERAKPAAEDNRPKPRPADGPPPAPQVEIQPPRASENAVWVPGYWRWNGFRWLWLYGFWRVPQSDLDQEKTAVAPDEPPPAKVETVVAAPFPDAVWTPGYWHWQSGAWVWVPGRWLVPPSAGNQWRRPRWHRTPRGVILVPGHWIRR